jgi:NAD(P)-dependent dehydrogenase (short-subunit alcohol dehydrogenase family)
MAARKRADKKANSKAKQGVTTSSNPKAEKRAKGGPGKQQQKWPGSDAALRPQADHGETSYQGANKLKGKVALITGGDSGIGRAIAIAFAREGADVAISYYNEHADARTTVGWIEKAGRRALSIAGDIGDRKHCRKIVSRVVKELGGIDILVNNAAFQMETKDFGDITEEQLERTFRTNIFSFFFMTQAALEHMKEGAVILNTGSVTGMEGHAALVDYASTKGSIHIFTKSLAQQLAERGIRVNCVAPGPVWTPLIPATFGADHVEEFGKDTFWGRPAMPVEIAPSYVFLASADGRYYTGDVFAPTGRGSSR